MKINQQAIIDPLGNEVHLAGKLNKLTVNESEVYDDLTDVIKSPSIVIKGIEKATEIHYYRSIGWNVDILISAKKKGRNWVVTRCIQNPPAEKINRLIKEGSVMNFNKNYMQAS